MGKVNNNDPCIYCVLRFREIGVYPHHWRMSLDTSDFIDARHHFISRYPTTILAALFYTPIRFDEQLALGVIELCNHDETTCVTAQYELTAIEKTVFGL